MEEIVAKFIRFRDKKLNSLGDTHGTPLRSEILLKKLRL